MYDGNPGEIDFGSSLSEVRVSKGSNYRESTVYLVLAIAKCKRAKILPIHVPPRYSIIFFRNVLNNLHVFSRLLVGNYFTLSPGSLQLSLALAKSILIFSTLFFTTTATILNNNNIMIELATKIYECMNHIILFF